MLSYCMNCFLCASGTASRKAKKCLLTQNNVFVLDIVEFVIWTFSWVTAIYLKETQIILRSIRVQGKSFLQLAIRAS